VDDIAALTSAHVDNDVAEGGGGCGDLTDVYVEKLLADEATH
jgi:hypothetical protein